MQASFHQQVGFTRTNEFDRFLGGRLTMRSFDNFEAGDIEPGGSRDASHSLLGSDKDRDDHPGLRCLDDASKRCLVARVRDGGRER